MLDISIVNETSPEANWNRQADRQTDRQTNKQTDRQAGRQTDKQTNRQTDRQTLLVPKVAIATENHQRRTNNHLTYKDCVFL